MYLSSNEPQLPTAAAARQGLRTPRGGAFLRELPEICGSWASPMDIDGRAGLRCHSGRGDEVIVSCGLPI